MTLLDYARSMILNNANLPNTPWAKEAINAIMTGDSQKGAQIADNLCNSYGVTREEALKMAKDKMNLPF